MPFIPKNLISKVTARVLAGLILFLSACASDEKREVLQAPLQSVKQVALFEVDTSQPEIAQKITDMINRDLILYFKKDFPTDELQIESELLRKGPTPKGTAYPKFYTWVTVKNQAGQSKTAGAARLVATETENFEVSDFLPSSKINADPNSVFSVFPAPLYAEIVNRSKDF